MTDAKKRDVPKLVKDLSTLTWKANFLAEIALKAVTEKPDDPETVRAIENAISAARNVQWAAERLA